MSEVATPQERKELGKSRRKAVPRSSHAELSTPADRADPVSLLMSQDTSRLAWLVPIRHGRMSASPLAFYRGAAKIMAADLRDSPISGLSTQLCGDAHLSNFGTYASPDRRQVFDVNDFDETLPGPWEWDVKRLAASFVVAGRHRGFREAEARAAARRSARAYREAMADFAGRPSLDVWYAQASLDDIRRAMVTKRHRARLDKVREKARSRDSLAALSKLTERDGTTFRIRSDPPLVVPLRDLGMLGDVEDLRQAVAASLASYRDSLAHNRRRLLDTFRPIDVALKVVGVGSVGTRCFIVAFEGRDRRDPLFLQVKEATPSVLEGYLADSIYRRHGRRVVEGQRLMQASSDIFLGYSPGEEGRHFYWRQLRDMKGSFDVEVMEPSGMGVYARVCGWTLAHAHARAGDPIAISGYLGSGDVFDRAIEGFASAYADQNERDYATYLAAIELGRVQAHPD